MDVDLKGKRVLCVGAGGIGCEVLKNLALCGFEDVEVVDLDTIDLSNLNRQFLFRRQHISKSKAKVAAEAVKRMNPSLDIKAYQSNVITDPYFDLDYFGSFDIIINALDNIEARRHVNGMCLAVGVPLIEAGTAGLLGQAQPFLMNGRNECFDCIPHDTPKVFPVCTIRSSPSKPIHCIVWAKSFLFAQLFGEFEEDDATAPSPQNDNELEELKKLRVEAQALKRLRESYGSSDYVQKIFDKIYCSDIERVARNVEMWKDKTAPKPLSYNDIYHGLGDNTGNKNNNNKQKQKQQQKVKGSKEVGGLDRDHKVWTVEMTVQVFTQSCEKLAARSQKEGIMDFDKDDEDMMDFVTAAANLRSHVYAIPLKTRFEIKEMAGNIIPAIASTNAIISGLQVIMALKVLASRERAASGDGNGGETDLKSVYLSYTDPKKILIPESLVQANPSCVACSSDYRQLTVDCETMTLRRLVDDVLRRKLHLMGEELAVMKGKDSLIFDADFDDNLDSTLASLGIKNGSRLMVSDEDDEEGDKVPLFLIIKHKSNCKKFTLNSDADLRLKPPKPKQTAKRKLEDLETDGDAEQAVKKEKIEQVIIINDDDGSIELD